MKRIAPFLLIVSFLLACQDSEPTGPSEPGPVSLAIFDGAHGGNTEFFFLPPLVPNPKKNLHFGDSPFNPDLAPFVRICELDNANPPNCVVPLAPDLPMAVKAEKYKVNWKTKDFNLDNSKNYRIQVMVGTNTVIGFRDVDPESGGKKKKAGGKEEPFLKFKNGRTFPIKVRIEEFAFCPDTRMCETKSFNLDDGASYNVGNNVLDIPPQPDPELTDPVTVSFGECTEEENAAVDAAIDLPTFGPCVKTDILTEEFGGELAEGATAIISFCDLPDVDFGLDPSQADHLRVHGFHEDGTIESLREALNCPGFSSLPANPVMRLASRIRDRVRSWVGVRPLMAAAAVARGARGGDSERTIGSFWKLALGAKIEFVDIADEERTAEVGSTLSTQAKVTDIDNIPVAGATVRWNVVPAPPAGVEGTVIPSASCAVGTTDDVVCTTPASGIVEVSWTLDSDPGANELTAAGRGIADPREPFNGPRDGTYPLGPFDPFTPIAHDEKVGDGIESPKEEGAETIPEGTRLLFTAFGKEFVAGSNASVTVDVNNYQLTINPDKLDAATFNGTDLLFNGSISYGNSSSAVLIYNTSNAVADFGGAGIERLIPGPVADHQTRTVMNEQPGSAPSGKTGLGFVIVRETFAFTAAPDDDFVIVKYTLNNQSASDVSGLHVGQIIDADVVAIADDKVEFVSAEELVRVTSPGDPPVGFILLSDNVTSYRAWVNPSLPGSPALSPVDPSTNAGWFAFLSSGTIFQPNVVFGPADIRHSMTVGPVTIANGGTRVIAFALLGGTTNLDLSANATAARAKWATLPQGPSLP